jgi:poly-gamma-glutamate synthesis protein (capsule biosynthesis protein)
MEKKLITKLFLIIFLFTISVFTISFLIKPRTIEIQVKDQVLKTPENFSKEISLILVGDIMLDRGIKIMMVKNKDWKFPFLKIADELKKANILFGNLEGPISDKGRKVGSIYSFRHDPKSIEGLTFAGFNVISLANNHVLDYTREALEDTFLRLKKAGIDYVGAGLNENEAFSPIIKEIQGTKIGFLAYTNLGPESWRATEKNSGIAWVSESDFEKIKEDIKKAKEKVDVLIVSLHSGQEYKKEPDQFQIKFSRMAIDAGADIIVGHHPHVIQPNEKYKNGYIFYSLGNFVFDQNFSKETMEGEIVKVLIENNKIKEAIPINIKINELFQPEIENK